MTDKVTPKFEVAVEGSPVGADVIERIIAIGVRQDSSLANMIELRLSNAELEYTESDTFAEGKKLEVKLGYVETDLVLVATGTIVRRECEFPERGPAVVTIVAYDKRFTLKQASHVRAWTDIKDSDVVSQLAQGAGLSADVDATTQTHKYLFQHGRTDLGFIFERAFANGYVVHVDETGQKLAFKKPKPGEGAKVKLKWGKDLLSFRPRFSTADQVSEVTVRGWSLAEKKEVKGSASASDIHSPMGLSVIGADRTKKAYGARPVLITAAVATVDECKAMAKAFVNQSLYAFAEGEGSCQGHNAIAPGAVIELESVGARASGKYLVTSTFHHVEPKGYVTYFNVVRPGEAPASESAPPKKAPAQRTASSTSESPSKVDAQVRSVESAP